MGIIPFKSVVKYTLSAILPNLVSALGNLSRTPQWHPHAPVIFGLAIVGAWTMKTRCPDDDHKASLASHPILVRPGKP